MALKFSDTRKYFWRSLEFIKDYARDGNTVFDFGCGNGRLLELFHDKNVKYYGGDVSGELISLAKNKYSGNSIKFLKLDPSQVSLPFDNNFFNAVYSIAVFHHFPGKEYREEMAKELYRITKPEGYVVITVWNLWPASLRLASIRRSGQAVSASRGGQRKYLKNIIENWVNKILGKSDLDWNDSWITFKDNNGNIFKRYHHAFTKKEVENLFSKAGFKKEMIVKGKNIIYIGQK